MKCFYKFLTIALFQFCFISTVESQTINIVRFNTTASYTAGSGVSVIINPTGIFQLNNQFILELSNLGGIFPASPTVLTTLNEFYVPVINGTLPTGLAAGTYKLRVRATTGLGTTPETYPIMETLAFNIISGSSDVVSATSDLTNNSSYFNCTLSCLNTTNTFGSLTQSAGATSTNLPKKKITICNYSNTDNYKITLIDVINGTQTPISYNNGNGDITIPDNLAIGTYIFEIEKNNKSVYGLVFLFHGNGTSLGNSTSEVVCVGVDVSFTVDITTLGIGRNYNGSKYMIDFGDNSTVLELTQAQLMSNPTITHNYTNVSCAKTDSNFIIKETLLNKGVYNGGANANYCAEFYKNGNGVEKKVNVSLAPKADFTLANKQCINLDITAVNKTILGSYGSSGNCLDKATFTWYYKKHGDISFTEVTISSWIDSLGNLKIPKSIITITGCWEIKLTAVNEDLCQTLSEVTKTIKIETPAIPSFTYFPLSPICPNTQIQFTNTSNVDSLACQEPTYLWTVSPSTGYQFVNPSNSASKDPLLLFTNPGIYTVTLSVTNSCGTVTTQKNIEVSGSPTVSFNPNTLSFCTSTPPSYTIDFSQAGTIPIYSPPPYAPSSYAWTVTGAGVTASDYSYIGGTTASSQYPKITFTSYKTYAITVVVNGNCPGSGQATFTFALKETPIITNTDLTQTICSGTTSTAIPLTSQISGTSYSWTATTSSGITGFSSPGNGTSIPASVLTNPTNSVATVTYVVTPSNNGCTGIPVSFVITVTPKPVVSPQNKTICSGTAFTVSLVNGSGNIVPAGTTYTWADPVSNPAGAITGGSLQATDQLSISQTLTNTTSSAATLTYTVTPKSGASGACVGNPFTVTVTVNPTPTAMSLTNQEYCNGTTTTSIIFNNSVTGTTYAWTNSNAAIGLAASGTGNIPSFMANNTNSSPITATISLTPTANGCVGTAQTFSITVNPSPIVAFSLPNQVICSGDSSALVALSSVAGATLNWTAVQPAGISAIATSGTTTIPAQTLINSSNANIVVTYQATATLASGVTCAGAVFSYTITVKPKPLIAANMTAVTCSGASFTVTPTNGAGNSIPTGTTYTWTTPTVTGGVTGGNTGTNATSISGTLTNPTNVLQTATYTVIPTVNSCSGSPFDVVVSVNPKPDVNATTNIVLCAGETSNQIDFTGSVSGTTYTWSSSNTSIGIAASGTNSIPSFTALNTGTTPTIATITVTPSANTCAGSFKTFTITINPKPTVSPTGNLVKCNGAASGTISFTGSVAGTTFDWTNDQPTIGLAAAGSGNISSFTTTNTGTSPITATLTVTPKANGCSGTSSTFTITVNPTPTVNMPSNQTVCNGQSTTAILFSGAIPNTTYNWTNNSPTIGIGANGTGAIPPFTAVNNGTSPIIASIRVTPNLDGCSGVYKEFTITINPSPTVTFTPVNQVLCSGSSSALVNLSSAMAGTNFSWTAVQPTGINGVLPSGTNTIPVQTLTNSTNLPIVVTYLATAESNSGVNCQGIAYPYTITVNPVPSITTAQVQTICSNTAFSIIPLDGSGNIVPAGTTYSWGLPVVTGGITGGTALNNQTTINGNLTNPTDVVQTATYTVTPKSGTCIGSTFTVVITVNPSPKVLFSGSNQTLCSGSDSLPISLSSPTTGNITFHWSANVPTGITGAAASGTGTIPTQTLVNTTTNSITLIYTATATVENNGVSCTGQPFDYKITVNPALVTSSILSNFNGFNVSTVGANDGAINVTVSGGSGAYTYLWSGPGGFSAGSQDISNVPAGAYSLIINDGLCNPVTLNFTLSSPMPLLIQEDVAAHVDVLCFGYLTGVVKVDIIQQSVGLYDYVLSLQGSGTIKTITDTAATTYTFTDLAAGIYDVKVTDANGSLKTISGIVITQPSGITANISAQTDVSCAGSTTGSATVTASGGNGTLTYSWNTNPIQTTATATGLTAGTYTVTITDANTCSIQKQAIITEPNAIVTSIASQTNVLCFGNHTGSATISASGGTGILSYSWDTVPVQTTATATGLAAGTYHLTITDANNCPKVQEVIITQPSAGLTSLISNSTDVSCFGGNNGIATATVSGGTAPYTYSWNTVPQQTLATATGLKAGNYTVSISDANGCGTSTSITINEPAGMTANITAQTNVFCSGNSTGSATVTAAGGTQPYSYSWNTTPIQTSDVAVNLPMGTYNVTVTDAKGCTTTTQATITEPNGIVTSIASQTNVDCFGNNTGAVTVSASGGAGTLSYSWDTIPVQTTPTLTGLISGTYNLTVTDANNCTKGQTVTITQPDEIVIATDLEKDITCYNDANGAIKITITGGTIPYNYNWTKNGTAFGNSEDLSNLSHGTYKVTVSDANNCGPKTTTFTITEPPILAVSLISQTNILCFSDATGTININVSGGTPAISGYTFAWTGPNGFSSSNQNLGGLLAGTYNLVVTDNSGCFKTLSVTLTQPQEVVLKAATTPIICYGGNDASISLTITGGIAPYQISWSNLGSGTFQNNLSAGDYLVSVTDANNCTKTLNVNIPEAPIFTVNPVVKNISCFGANNGSINLNFVGGIAPIKLTWSDGSVAGTTRNNLKPGSYTVTIVDSKPCTIVRTFIILEPQPLVLSANVTNALDCNNANSGAINLLVSGGSAPFTYAWSNGATTEDLTNIPAGNYLVTVTDANGCTQQAQFSINRPPPIVPGVVTKTEFDCETKYVKQTFVAQVSGGVPPYQLLWSSGTVSGVNNEMMNTNQNGTVILYVTDAIGCQANYSFNVDVPTLGTPSFDVSSYAYSTFGTYSINDPIQFTNTATGDYAGVAWDFGDGSFSTEPNPVHTFVNPKDYVVTQTVTYPFGCVYVQKITLVVGKGYVLVVPNAFTPNNDRFNNTFRPVTKGLKNIHLDVYDTWGSLIYSETGDLLKGWDGKIKGLNAENGNYYCKVSGETFYGIIVNDNHPFVLIK